MVSEIPASSNTYDSRKSAFLPFHPSHVWILKQKANLPGFVIFFLKSCLCLLRQYPKFSSPSYLLHRELSWPPKGQKLLPLLHPRQTEAQKVSKWPKITQISVRVRRTGTQEFNNMGQSKLILFDLANLTFSPPALYSLNPLRFSIHI